jgi:hypothetical protein
VVDRGLDGLGIKVKREVGAGRREVEKQRESHEKDTKGAGMLGVIPRRLRVRLVLLQKEMRNVSL